jgi:GTPase SAR1 family protein
MKMERSAEKNLLAWKESPLRKPLLIYGARQVGKTWLMKQFGTKEFDNTVYVNLEKEIQDRINKVSSPNIKPMSPPKFPNLGLDPSISTPAVLPYNEINIIESENENEAVPAPNINMDFSSLLLGAQHTPPKFVQEALAEYEAKNLTREISSKDSVEEEYIN